MFSPATYKTLFMSRAKKGKWGQNILESYSYFQGLALKVDNSKQNLYRVPEHTKTNQMGLYEHT